MMVRCHCCGSLVEAELTPKEEAHLRAEDAVRDILARLAALDGGQE